MADAHPEADLIHQAQGGDQAAFEALIINYQRMVHAVTYRMTGSLSEAEDLSQETFIQAYRRLGTFRAEARFSSWLYRIAMNQCLTWLKQHRRRQQAEEESVRWMDPPPSADTAARVEAALRQLSPEQRAAIILTTYEGLNHADAARALGCAETTISWRVFNARKKLKKILLAKDS